MAVLRAHKLWLRSSILIWNVQTNEPFIMANCVVGKRPIGSNKSERANSEYANGVVWRAGERTEDGGKANLEAETQPATPMLSGVGLRWCRCSLRIGVWWRRTRIEVFITYTTIVAFRSPSCGIALRVETSDIEDHDKINWAHQFTLRERNIDNRRWRMISTNGPPVR